MSAPSLLDWAAELPDTALAPQSVRMDPPAIQARRSGRAQHRPPVAAPTESMLVYRDALRRIQPATDHEASAAIRDALGLDGRDHVAWGLSTVNGRRNDWRDFAAGCIYAIDRVKADGWRTSRARWAIKPGSVADTWEAGS